jgi:hypothetical protein
MLGGAQRAKPASSPKRVIITAAALIAVILALVSAFALRAVRPHGLSGRHADVEG